MNVWHPSRLEQDCITAYPQVTHKIEMCLSWENPGAKIVNKINVQCVRINEHVLGSYITWGNKKTAQQRFPWVIERNTGSYFYYLIAKDSPIFLSEFIKEKIHTGSKVGVGWVGIVWRSSMGEIIHFMPKKDSSRKHWNTKNIYMIIFLDNFSLLNWKLISLVSK